MALPLIRILSKMAPVVTSAFDLYRRTQEAREAARGPARDSTTPDALLQRIRDLENADVEQTRLISELSNTVEVLATSLEKEVEAGERRTLQLQRLLGLALALCALTGGAVIWLAWR